MIAALFWRRSTKWGALAATLWVAAAVAGNWWLYASSAGIAPTEVSATGFFDFVWLDQQHAPLSDALVADMCLVARAIGITPIVRPTPVAPDLERLAKAFGCTPPAKKPAKKMLKRRS